MTFLLHVFFVTIFLLFAEGANKCPKLSIVNGAAECTGKVVFRDDFNDLSAKRWTHEIRLSEYPDFEFNFYNKSVETAYVKDGILYIRPRLVTDGKDDSFLHNGTIELTRYPPDLPLCTRLPDTKSCSKRGQNGFRILPPITSSRMLSTTRFRYGTVKIKAQMPLGDWIYPQIELTPVRYKYGKNSGKIVIALARGNLYIKRPLGDERLDFGTRWLEAGVFPGIYDPLKTSSMVAQINVAGYYDDFKEYRLDWRPDGFQFYVDDVLVGQKITTPPKGFLPWAKTKMAPFNEEMVVAIGVGVGGIQRFPDGILNNGKPKPWQNLSPKGMYDFWKAKDEWYPTWQGDNSALKIDYVEIAGLKP